ncbi:type II secretion system F family protein [Acetobacter pasteurianus]|uniref:type II secretion system F family protein n=1 Tax=Acetobacter pasteurianus TaxID=438 RepID=UPI0013628FE8|nr:type II secretion system F family protein [Acetobacter pasteurianus]QHM90030.1 type II secretion system F family protein [Acetobacter pasteurianus]
MALNLNLPFGLHIDIASMMLQYRKIRFNAGKRIKVYEMLESLTSQGNSINDALALVYEITSEDGKKPNKLLAYITKDWYDQIRGTVPLSDAVAEWVPARERMAISASGKTGNIAAALRDVIFIMKGEQAIKSAIKGALKEPAMYLVMSFALYYVFATDVIPQFKTILPEDKWGGLPYVALWLSEHLAQTFIPAVFIMIFIIIAIIFSIPRWTGRIRVTFDNIPPWSVYRILIGGSFLLTYSSLKRSGVSDNNILTLLTKGASPWLMERIMATRHILALGNKNLGDALYESGLEFPSKDTTIVLRAYARNPSTFDEKLEIVGREWLKDGVQKTQNTISTLGVIIQLFFYGVIAFFGAVLSLLELQLMTQN